MVNDHELRYLSFKAKDKDIFGPHYLSLICELPAAGRYRVSLEAVEGPTQGQVQFFRNEVGIATMAVGNITEADYVNSILMAGRADLVCLARPHLADPYWTLHTAARAGDTGETWPKPYLAGRDQLYRLAARAETWAETWAETGTERV